MDSNYSCLSPFTFDGVHAICINYRYKTGIDVSCGTIFKNHFVLLIYKDNYNRILGCYFIHSEQKL